MARGAMKVTLEPLLRERDRLIDEAGRLYEQAEAVSNKIAGLEIAIALLERGDGSEQTEELSLIPPPSVKGLLLDLAREAKTDGLNATIAVKMAAKRGVALKRGTAASNLSRLKADNALVHGGNRYRLPEFVRLKSTGLSSASGPLLATAASTILGSIGMTGAPGSLEVVGTPMLRKKSS